MKKIIIEKIFVFIFLVLILVILLLSNNRVIDKNQAVNKITAISVFGKKGSGVGEFEVISSMTIHDKYFYVADSGNSRIQAFQIDKGGGLLAKFAFGKEGTGLAEFKGPTDLCIKDNLLFVADSANFRIQGLEIQSNGRLSPKLVFGKEGVGLGQFGKYITALAVKDNYVYVGDTGNSRIQVLEIKY